MRSTSAEGDAVVPTVLMAWGDIMPETLACVVLVIEQSTTETGLSTQVLLWLSLAATATGSMTPKRAELQESTFRVLTVRGAAGSVSGTSRGFTIVNW